MHSAEQSARTALIDGRRTVEVVQACTLLSAYPVPTHLREEDRTQVYLDLAIRIAIGLNLHLPWQGDATDEAHERETLNRTRTWLILFNMWGFKSALELLLIAGLQGQVWVEEGDITRSLNDWYKLTKHK
ncbi:hypothetical protein FRC10_010613 [Ceratobasidium sp. 414]|nr:hypothetical protein FRC10_010613 [Ceratobasidium sp. 414]